MCGIIGIVKRKTASDITNRDVVNKSVEMLTRLEYRGYDSAGVGFVDGDHKMQVIKRKGQISKLKEAIEHQVHFTNSVIAHTRWATHGNSDEVNAHPQSSQNQDVILIHNGIIENYLELKKELINSGYSFVSNTDTEIIANLVEQNLRQLRQSNHPSSQSEDKDIFYRAIRQVVKRLHGSFSLCFLFKDAPNEIIATKKNMPLIAGVGSDYYYLASDIYALAGEAEEAYELEDGDFVIIKPDSFMIYDSANGSVERAKKLLSGMKDVSDKGDYAYFMEKEMHQQPEIILNLLANYVDYSTQSLIFDSISEIPQEIYSSLKRVVFVACGTSYYAGSIACYWIRKIFKDIQAESYIASEFRYFGDFNIKAGEIYIFLSQSGETADTLAAMNHVKKQGGYIIALLNKVDSSMARIANNNYPVYAGVEIGVASSKSFISQLFVLQLLIIQIMHKRTMIKGKNILEFAQAAELIASQINELLANNDKYIEIAKQLTNKPTEALHDNYIFYTGRGSLYPMAMEGALKMRELSYLNADSIATGELKHGHIALVSAYSQTIALMGNGIDSGEIASKMVSNLNEIKAREGRILLLCDYASLKLAEGISDDAIVLTTYSLEDKLASILSDPRLLLIKDLLYAIPMQKIAYHTAKILGNDIDKPRNLAKSVTVE